MVLKIEASTGREAGRRWHLRLLRSPPQRLPDKLWEEACGCSGARKRQKGQAAFVLGKEGHSVNSHSLGRGCLVWPGALPASLPPLTLLPPPPHRLPPHMSLPSPLPNLSPT